MPASIGPMVLASETVVDASAPSLTMGSWAGEQAS
jgi:hypothetical protein